MKELLEFALFVVIWAAIVFVFYGEPDVWDKWHAQAMEAGCPK